MTVTILRTPISGWVLLVCVAFSPGLLAQNTSQQGVISVSDQAKLIQIPNAKQPAPNLLPGGQPTEADLRAAAAAGYKTVINLRPSSELPDIEESGLVQSLGMDFISIPVGGAADLSKENAHRLDRALANAQPGPVMIHCASGNRVGALLAIRAHEIEGKSAEQALEFGKAAGLTTLEDAVKQHLK